jgi:light-regulated signal transduction histidine kinase (bacteriophytochrome)
MQTLIQDLLTYSRVGTRGASFEPTECQAVLEQVLMNLEVAIAESDADISSGALPSLSADASQLAQLLQNLIGNAIKFRGDSPPRIRVEASQRTDDWLFSVQDNGIGIDPRYSDRIFQVFQRLHGIGQYPGTGIGLAVCKKIVERHQGNIWVESQPDDGATFFFTIPVRLDSLPDPDLTSALTGPAG